MKIGIFGGSFDPVHYGHLMMAEQTREAFELDQVILMPAWMNPFKTGNPPAEAKHRLKMTQIAAEGNSRFLVSSLEAENPETSYTIDTLLKLKKNYPEETEFFLMGGSDLLSGFQNWKQWERILTEARMIIFSRGEEDARNLKDQYPFILPFHSFTLSLSSTFIRDLIRQGRSIRYLVPEGVREYIEKNSLYQISDSDDKSV